MKISRDNKGRASSIELDERSRDSLKDKNENIPTTTSNDEEKFLSKKQSTIRRGRSIESIDKTLGEKSLKIGKV